LQRVCGITGPVGTSAAANIFVGMVEAPLLIKPYLADMSRGGLFATMTVGMAGVAGTVLALYAAMLEPTLPGAAGHLIVASVISVPAGLMISELMVPDHGARKPIGRLLHLGAGDYAWHRTVLGWAFAPMAWALGIPWSECAKAGTSASRPSSTS
jgi:concentrative nucleoside transporter, CNT family